MSSDDKKLQSVTVEFIEREHDGKVRDVYKIMDELIDEHHPHLIDADIALCWKYGWRADTDGRVKVVQAAKANQTDKELRPAGKGLDFVIYLNAEIFNSAQFTRHEAFYWIDFSLSCCKSDIDSDGEQKRDENKRLCWRLCRPPLQIFPDVYQRHGCVLPDMAHLRKLMFDREDLDRPLIAMIEGQQAERNKAPDDEEDADWGDPGLEAAPDPEPVTAKAAADKPGTNGHHEAKKGRARTKAKAK